LGFTAGGEANTRCEEMITVRVCGVFGPQTEFVNGKWEKPE
jgi:hypothetical protein